MTEKAPGKCDWNVSNRRLYGALARKHFDFYAAGKCILVISIWAACTLRPGPALTAEPEPSVLTLTVTGFDVQGENPLSAEETARVVAPHRGEHTGIKSIEAAADALQKAINDKGFAFYRVVLPAQKPEGGLIVLKVVRFAVDSVRVTGNKHFSEANIQAAIPALRSGVPPDARLVARSLAISNENPAKRAAVHLRENTEGNAIDAEIQVEDRAPQQVFASVSNTGTSETGSWRTSIGYQHANLFDRDHILTASFTTSPDHFDDVKQYGLFYAVPLYALGDSLSAFFVYSDVTQGTVADFFQVSGAGKFFGARYTHALDKHNAYGHKLVATLEERLFENNVKVIASGAAIGVDVGSTPLSLRYEGSYLWTDKDPQQPARGSASFYVEGSHNLGIGPDNNQTSYRANRAGADRAWSLARYGAEMTLRLPAKWTLNGRFDAQWAGEPLIAAEQFGMGGASSVRGFREREVSGDDGYRINLELWSPPVAESVWFLAFVDAGHRRLYDPPPGQDSKENLASVGVGLRWNWRKKLEVSFDAARVVNGCTSGCFVGSTNGTSAGAMRGHFALMYRFQ